MNDEDIIEIIALCNLVSYDSRSMPTSEGENIKLVKQTMDHLVDIFFEDNEFIHLSAFFNRVKNGLKNTSLTKDNEVFIYREMITFITEQYNKKYGEDVALRVFMHLNII